MSEFDRSMPDKDSIDWLVKVAENAATSEGVLHSLAWHQHADVRIAVADNPNTPIAVLVDLARDENPDVRYALAENHNITIDVLQLLSVDTNPYVAHRAAATIDRLRFGKVVHRDFGMGRERGFRAAQ